MLRNMKPLIILFTLLPFLCAADIYKSTTEDGAVEYSDQPQEKLESLQLVPLTTIKSPPPSRSQQSTVETPPSAAVPAAAIVLQSPKDDEGVRSNNGELFIIVSVTPAGLDKQQHIELVLDGQRLSQHYQQTEIHLQEIERGSHTLQALLVKKDGAVVSSSGAIRFHLLRHSVLFTP